MISPVAENSANSGAKRKAGPTLSNRSKSNKIAKVGKSCEKPSSSSKSNSKSKLNPVPNSKHKTSKDEATKNVHHYERPSSHTEKENEEVDNQEPSPKIEDGLHPERAKAVMQNGQSSRESHAKQKQLAQERRASKPLANDLARTKKIWERLRRKSHVPVLERKKLVNELFEIITGRVKDFVLKHDSVRVVQTAIKYANPDQKKNIAKELAGTYRQLAESRYAKFLIGKLLVHTDDKIRDIIIPEFFGHVRRHIKHPESSWILDDIYRGAATKQQKARILRECYGAEFALFQKGESENVTSELSEIIKTDPGKRASIMRSLLEFVNQLIQKKMTGFTLLHDAMLQYYLNAKPGTSEAEEFLEILKGDDEGDLFKNLAFTKSGSRLVCLVLSCGNAKDRKQILRAYKDTIQMMATNQYGHTIILTAYEVIDDTVFTAKSIFPELLSKDTNKQVENAVLFANNLNARTTLLYLYQGRSKSLFPSSHSSDLDILKEIDTARLATSKKDPETRRSELARELSPYLLGVIKMAASQLVTTSFGCQFVTEILLGAQGDKDAALHAVAATAGGGSASIQQDLTGKPTEVNANNETNDIAHIIASSYRGKMLRSLLAGGHFDPETKSIIPIVPDLKFADILYPYIKNHIMLWATSPASFVILALVESKSFSKKDEVLELLRSEKKSLEKVSKEEISDKAISRSRNLDISADETTGTGKNSINRKKESSGNKGAALLLQLI